MLIKICKRIFFISWLRKFICIFKNGPKGNVMSSHWIHHHQSCLWSIDSSIYYSQTIVSIWIKLNIVLNILVDSLLATIMLSGHNCSNVSLKLTMIKVSKSVKSNNFISECTVRVMVYIVTFQNMSVIFWESWL